MFCFVMPLYLLLHCSYSSVAIVHREYSVAATTEYLSTNKLLKEPFTVGTIDSTEHLQGHQRETERPKSKTHSFIETNRLQLTYVHLYVSSIQAPAYADDRKQKVANLHFVLQTVNRDKRNDFKLYTHYKIKVQMIKDSMS